MTKKTAGTYKKRLFGRNDYLAPLPVPTGKKPDDVMNIVWRKNDVYMDFGYYSLGAGVILIWSIMLLCGAVDWVMGKFFTVWVGAVIVTPGLIILAIGLYRPVPLPLRFNRQRREVCVPREDGEYWIVPWETVTAISVEQYSVGPAGKTTTGMLFIGFDNPDPHAAHNNRHFSIGLGCGGTETGKAQWECMRSYMEIGPDAMFDYSDRFQRRSGVLKAFVEDLVEAAERKGWFLALLWEGFVGLFIFNTLLIDVLERWKLYPPPDLPYPEIIEWSKPLPPEQWAKRSAELEAAIAQRERELLTS